MKILGTSVQNAQKARSVDQTSASFETVTPTTNEPTGDAATTTGASVIELSNGSGESSNLVKIVPYGQGADTNTFSMRVYGYQECGTGATKLWVPVLLGQFLCTITTAQQGSGNTIVQAARYFCDVIALTYPTSSIGSIEVVAPAPDTIGHVVLDTKGYSKLRLEFQTGGSATACNALISAY